MFKGVFIIYSSYIKLCKRSIVDGYVEKYMFDCVSIYSESPLNSTTSGPDKMLSLEKFPIWRVIWDRKSVV